MRFLPLSICALLFAVPAKADKFWLSDPATQKTAAEGSSPNVIEGVLIAESDEGYHVRVVGGEILLPKASVFKVEKDQLSLDDIVKSEKDDAAKNEAAERERHMAQAAAQREKQAKAVEASARRSEARAAEPAPAPAPVQPVQGTGFDPVLGVATGNSGDLLRDAQIAWTLTQDPRYLKLVRVLRRMR